MKILVTGGAGYIGSRVVDYLDKEGFDVYWLDLNIFSENKKHLFRPGESFTSISDSRLNCMDAVIHLAAHSSVKACEVDPKGSVKNNCLDFFNLVHKLNPKTKFIYASSGSVYGAYERTHYALRYKYQEYEPVGYPVKEYDAQKQLIDSFMLTTNLHPLWYGLRFGTVCGYSPNVRNELILNAMTKSAILNNNIIATSVKSKRAILGLNDLCRALTTILLNDKIESGIYNLSSFNTTVGDLAKNIASYVVMLNVIESLKEEDSNTSNFHSSKTVGVQFSDEETSNYSFTLDTRKFMEAADFEFKDSVGSLVKEVMKNDFTKEREWEQIKNYFNV
jgi:UDP-glucose 4-epimerase